MKLVRVELRKNGRCIFRKKHLLLLNKNPIELSMPSVLLRWVLRFVLIYTSGISACAIAHCANRERNLLTFEFWPTTFSQQVGFSKTTLLGAFQSPTNSQTPVCSRRIFLHSLYIPLDVFILSLLRDSFFSFLPLLYPLSLIHKCILYLPRHLRGIRGVISSLFSWTK